MKRRSSILTAFMVCVVTFLFMASQSRAATEAQIEAAIESGLAWLATQQVSAPGPTFGSWNNSVGHTGLAVLKFEDYARELNPPMYPFDPNYVYHQNVIDGLNYIFSLASVVPIDSNQPAGDPDTRVNGKGVCWNNTYHTSIAMMAIAGSKDPNRTVSGGACDTWTYKAVLQDAVDYLAYGQTDINDSWGNNCNDRGGWYYGALDNSCGSDNSNAGYAVLGLGYAQTDPFNCTVPAWVMNELSLYCDYIQNDQGVADDAGMVQPDGGSGYSSPTYWVNVLKTGNLLYEMALTGDDETTARVTYALDYLERHWSDNADPGWRPNHYQAMYTCMKGLEAMGIFTFGDPNEPIDWYEDFSDAIVSQQDPNGCWSGCPCYCSGAFCNDCGKIICTAWALLTLERSVAPLIRPVVSDIPDQCVLAGDSFAAINLDDYVEDGDNDDSEISWTATGGVNIIVSIDASRVATITYPVGWTGSETITFTATDPDNQSDCDEAVFIVDPVPVVSGIPDQTAPFVTFDLDGYLSGIDPSLVTWSYSGNTCLQVSIDSDNVVTITNPGVCQDPEDITFTAEVAACGQGVTDSDTATFIPNQPPDCSDAQADNDCLWPPNHKFVDVGIVGVTDPDGDPITITITGITSDEPTATAKGAGGAKHAPDADGVGTDTAGLRAERSGSGLEKGESGAGPGNGRVYEISFTADDGRGGECEGTVQVKVPHDIRKHTCDAIDDGRIYDATQIN